MSSQSMAPLPVHLSSRISQELIDDILDELQDSTPTLKQCSLVSSTWSLRCRHHLFFKVIFRFKINSLSGVEVQLEPPLTVCQSIAPYIRHAVVALRQSKRSNRVTPEMLRSMLAFVAGLPKLQWLTMLGVKRYDVPRYSFSTYAINMIRGSTTLKTLHIYNQWFTSLSQLRHLLQSLPFLEALHLERIQWPDEYQPSEPRSNHNEPPALQALQELQLGMFNFEAHTALLLDWMASQPTMSQLRSFTLDCPIVLDQYCDTLRRFLDIHGRRLHHLCIPPPRPSAGQSGEHSGVYTCTH